jgi:hypothetical protein
VILDKLLYDFLVEFLNHKYKSTVHLGEDQKEYLLGNYIELWEEFCNDLQHIEGKYSIIESLIKNTIKEIYRRDKIRCQYCRIDEGLSVTSPVKAENLCRYHRNEYEEKFYDKTKDYVK